MSRLRPSGASDHQLSQKEPRAILLRVSCGSKRRTRRLSRKRCQFWRDELSRCGCWKLNSAALWEAPTAARVNESDARLRIFENSASRQTANLSLWNTDSKQSAKAKGVWDASRWCGYNLNILQSRWQIVRVLLIRTCVYSVFLVKQLSLFWRIKSAFGRTKRLFDSQFYSFLTHSAALEGQVKLICLISYLSVCSQGYRGQCLLLFLSQLRFFSEYRSRELYISL